MDPRGLVLRSVAYHRASADTAPQARIRRHTYGATGLLETQWDPRLYALRVSEPATHPNQRTHYSLTGKTLRTQSVDAGARVLLRGVAGQVVARWDSRGAEQRYAFDGLLRPTDVFEQAAHEATARHAERFTYGANDAPNRLANRSGRLIRHDDPSGALLYEAYSLQGQLLNEQRMFYTSLTEHDLKADSPRFSTTWHYNAFAEVVEHIDAKGNSQHTQYAVDGQLQQHALTLKGGSQQVLVDQRVVNARGQLESERSGNNVLTTMQYSPLDGRLKRLTTYRSGEKKTPLQDLTYDYDHVGNVLRVSDTAQPTQWSNNAQINAVSTYLYDSLYQLISATGRENAHNTSTSNMPGLVQFGATDNSVWRNYTQTYTYDEGGNLAELKHHVSTGHGYTRSMLIAQSSNHAVLKSTDTPALPPGLGRDFDLNGNQLALVRGQTLQWNVNNNVQAVTLVTRENGSSDDEMYAYDGLGQRTRKVRTTRTQGLTHTVEVLYLPGLEIRRDSATGEHLNVVKVQAGNSDIKVLQWDAGRPQGMPDNGLRFSLSDHLGSSVLELDGKAGLITQESYYPFGGTAWWAGRNEVQASYKTLRYSGKERDATGLYYYGYRYYAPWLYRWLNPDPGGAIDGLNLYGFVGNDPMGHVDADGRIKRRADGSVIAEAAGSDSGLEQLRNEYFGDESLGSFSDIGSAPPTPAPSISDFDEGLFSPPSFEEQYETIVGRLPAPVTEPQPGTSSQGTFRVPAVPALKRFYCGAAGCGKGFIQRTSLTKHLLTHTGERPHLCTEPGCSMSFSQASHLKSHLLTHTGERPHLCTAPGCSMSFSLKGTLKAHLRTHTGEKPYRCTELGCSMSFSRQHTLKDHLRTHTGERPYPCTAPGCSKSFTISRNLTRHMRTHSSRST